jgi:hypothetical protein
MQNSAKIILIILCVLCVKKSILIKNSSNYSGWLVHGSRLETFVLKFLNPEPGTIEL